MIALLKTTVSSLVVFATALVITAALGLLTSVVAIGGFGAITVVFFFILGCLLFLPLYAGYAIGTIAFAFDAKHCVLTATVAAFVVCFLTNAIAIAIPGDLGIFSMVIWVAVGIAPVRAVRLIRRQGHEID